LNNIKAIRLDTIEKTNDFVKMANRPEFDNYDIDLVYQRQMVDAKSILGVYALTTFNEPLRVRILCDEKETLRIFNNIMGQFEAENNER